MLKRFVSGRLGNILLLVFEIMVGVLLLVNPTGFTTAIVVGTGILMTIAGVVCATLYFAGEPVTMAARQLLFKGLLLVLAGLLAITQHHLILQAFPILTVMYALAMLVLAAYKVQRMTDMLRVHAGRWYMPAASAALAALLALFILTNPWGATQVVWTFVGISLILEAALEIATLVLN